MQECCNHCPDNLSFFATNARVIACARVLCICSTSIKSSSTITIACFTMNSVHQIRNAVANIQDELQRIVTCSEVVPLERSHGSEDFKAKLIAEFNTKLRGFKSKVRLLTEENAQLKETIRDLERQLNHNTEAIRLTKSIGNLPRGPAMAPPKRQKINPEEDPIEILSSPIKQTDPIKSAEPLVPSEHQISTLVSRDITSSQFNRLPTQYSDTGDSIREYEIVDLGATKFTELRHPVELHADSVEERGGSRKPPKLSRRKLLRESSPVRVDFVEEDERVVADSQDENEPLGRPAGYPLHYTALQRIDFLRNYFRMKVSDLRYQVDLTINPITENPWVFGDFKPNGNWRRPKHLHSHVGVMTKAQERAYARFFQEAGHGAKSGGPQWEIDLREGDSSNRGDGKLSIEREGEDTKNDDEKENFQTSDYWVQSQVMDKYLSPPGYMVALFPSTQQQEQNKQMVADKSRHRLERRLASALAQGEFVFYEEVLNTYVAQGRYRRGS